LRALSIKEFSIPGQPGWPLGGLFPAPASTAEGVLFRSYMKQAREEVAIRLVDKLFDGPSLKNKWWQVMNF
jgi:actin related protein 2/3 complex, subunit 3